MNPPSDSRPDIADTRPGEIGTAEAKRIAAVMGDMETRRREAEGGDMRQDINIHRIYIPPFTQRVIMVCGGLLVLIAAWGGANIQLMQRDIAEQRVQLQQQLAEQSKQNAAVLVEIASIKADAAVTSNRVGGLESRTDKLEGRR